MAWDQTLQLGYGAKRDVARVKQAEWGTRVGKGQWSLETCLSCHPSALKA